MATLQQTIQRVTRDCKQSDYPMTIGLHQSPDKTWKLRGRTRGGAPWEAEVSKAESRAQAEVEAEAYLRRTYLERNQPLAEFQQ